MAIGSRHVDSPVRTDRVMYMLEDSTDKGCVYLGQTPSFDTPTSAAKWQIKRITFDGSLLTTEFANSAKYNAIWDDRDTYFTACSGTTVPIPGTVDTNTVNTPTIEHFELPVQNTEYSFTLPTGTKRFIIKNIENGLIKLAVVSGQSNTLYWPIEPGTTYNEAELGTVPVFFVQSPSNNQKIAIFSWK